MITKEIAEQKLSKTIQDFKENYNKYKTLSEADVETKLIEELFINVLGWEKSDFIKQEKVYRGDKRGRADYAFRINDKIVFFLEVKKLGIPLEKEADKQVISYALSQRVPFAISTNFEQMKIFCVEQENAVNNVFRVFKKPEDYLNNLSDLLFLSKESFQNSLLLKKASDEGRLKKRNSIDKILLEDLMHVRSLIATDIEKKYPQKYNINELDEIVQRILDRLIFIRRCEDIGIQPDDLRLFDITAISGDKAYPKLKELFKQYDKSYNSGLFALGLDNDCDKITIDGEIIKKLIHHLYESKDKEYIYNFDWIDADVLGQVYEQYLGKILQQTKSGKAKLKDGQAHRKEQGIYYTPTYIVDYIVKNAIEELTKRKKVNASEIKILDPACGSGSFLIKAFDYLNDYLKDTDEARQNRIDHQGSYSIKTEILKNNLFGVDLDNKAVEITKLNLLLKAAEKNRKLPEEVDLHIRHANSLVNDEKVAGLNAFKWEGDFQEGTFDIVIGNPPYGVEFNPAERDFFRKNYLTASRVIDSYILFIEKATKLLKKDGVMGFIIPESWLTNPSNMNLREYLIKNFSILKIVDIPGMVFPDATVDTVILILKNEKNTNNKLKIVFLESKNDIEVKSEREFSQKDYLQLKDFSMNTQFDKDIMSLVKSVEKDSIKLKEVCKNTRGIETGNNDKYLSLKKESSTFLPIITGEDIDRYLPPTNKYFVNYSSNLSNPKTLDLFKGEKIVLQRIKNQNLKRRLTATIDTQNRIILDSVHMIYGIDAKYSPYYVLAILNSTLLNFYFKLFSMYPRINADDLDNLPIKSISLEQQKKFIEPVVKILSLNNKIKEIGDKNTSEKAKMLEEIKKIDEQIDKDVYKLYGLTSEEIKIIEESLK